MFNVAICVVLVGTALCGDLTDKVLTNALNNPRELGSLFSAFTKSHQRNYQGVEARERISLFERHLREIHDHNEQHTSWREEINEFADKTDEERSCFLGLNTTGVVRKMERVVRRHAGELPEEVSWIDKGAVTKVKDQGGCGSCWAFGGVGSLEGVYSSSSGVLRAFSEQQVLDCTYEGTGNGCGGGWMSDAINGVRDGQNNVLASMAAVPYEGYDGECNPKEELNALIAARIVSYIDIEDGEESTIAALSQQVLSVTFHVLDTFFGYSSGIYRDDTYTSFPNHALTAVAYTPNYVVVKNSWGAAWGEQGFIRVARNYDGCSFNTYVGYAVVEPTGYEDKNKPDEATDYVPNDDDDGNTDPCEDNFTGCAKQFCDIALIFKYCDLTCGTCKADEECASGTIMCPDGVCRHEHMC